MSASPITVTYGLATAEATSAAGVHGVLCRSCDGSYFFRVYAPDGSFVDYDLRHDDLPVTIAPDALASFYRVGESNILDHSPEVLGLERPLDATEQPVAQDAAADPKTAKRLSDG